MSTAGTLPDILKSTLASAARVFSRNRSPHPGPAAGPPDKPAASPSPSSALSVAPSPFKLPAYPKSGNALRPLFDAGDIFAAENAVIQKGTSGDDLWLTIYELQHATINGQDRTAPQGIAGYDEQQALVPNLVAAQKRGVNVHVLVDLSDGWGKPSENIPMVKYLAGQGIDIRPYPTNIAKINHTKDLELTHHNADGSVEYWGVGGGGMNMGNHSAANHDTMILMAGLAPYNMLVHVIRPQWAAAGGDVSGIPTHAQYDPEVKWLNTAPPEENGGVAQDEIKKAYLGLLHKALDLSQQGYKPHIRTAQFVLSNPAVAYGLRDAALAGADVEVMLDPNIYVDMVKSMGDRAKWARQVVQSGGANVKFFNADVSTQQKMHDKWITLSYTNENGEEVPVEMISGSANASKAGLEPAGPPRRSGRGASGFASLMSYMGQTIPAMPFKGFITRVGGNQPPRVFFHPEVDQDEVQSVLSRSGKSTPQSGQGFLWRTNREADALIYNHDVIKAYNGMFDKMMAGQSADEPPNGSGFSEVF